MKTLIDCLNLCFRRDHINSDHGLIQGCTPWIVVFVIILLSAYFCFYFYNKNKKLSKIIAELQCNCSVPSKKSKNSHESNEEFSALNQVDIESNDIIEETSQQNNK